MRHLAVAVMVLAASMAFPAGCRSRKSESGPPLLVHVGGTMQPVIEELGRIFRDRTGQGVEINSADSGSLLAYIELGRSGDAYVCHDPFLDALMRKGLGVDGWTVAELTPVIVVRKGNPKLIRGLADLARPDVELALTDYEHSTLGRILPTIFAKADVDFARLNKDKEIAVNRSGGYVANRVKMGNADAAICWNAVAWLRRDALEAIPIAAAQLPVPGVDAITSATGNGYVLAPVRVAIATLGCSSRPEAARAFAEFLASADAAEVFGRFGFTQTRPRKEYHQGRRIESAGAE